MKDLFILWFSFTISVNALAICPQISGNFLCGENFKENVNFRSAIVNNVQKYKIDGSVGTVDIVYPQLITDNSLFNSPREMHVKLTCEDSTVVKYVGYLVNFDTGPNYIHMIKVIYSIDDFGDLSISKIRRLGKEGNYELISQTSCVRTAQ